MRNPLSVALVLGFLTATAFASMTVEPGIPDRFLRKWGGDVLWISARAALDSDGRIRPGVLRDAEAHEWQRRRRTVAADADLPPCDVEFVGYVVEGGDPEAATFAALRTIAASRRVITGTVTESAVGLHFGMPHTVLRIDTNAGDVAYLMIPHGRTRVDGLTICNADPAYAELPAAGDAVTAVVSSAIDSTGTFHIAAGSSIFYGRASAIVAPPALRNDPELHRFRSLADLAAELHGNRR